jgi:hypothetical protein
MKTPYVATPKKALKEIQPKEVLETALHYIDDYGWQQGGYGNKNVGFCLVGALQEAYIDLMPVRKDLTTIQKYFYGSHEINSRLFRTSPTAQKGFKKTLGILSKCVYPDNELLEPAEAVISFNDMTTRKKKEVKEKLLCAIEKAE